MILPYRIQLPIENKHTREEQGCQGDMLERREGEKRVSSESASYEPGTSHEPVIEGGTRLHSLAQVDETLSPPHATDKILVLSRFLWYSDRKELAFVLPLKRERGIMASRLFVLCACGSGRALLAASLLHATAGNRFEIWSAPTRETQEQALVEGLLQERGVVPL